MSQVDKMHFLPTFIWIVIIFILWYCIIIGKIIPMYYNTLRGRYIYEKNLWNKVKENEYVIRVIEIFYSVWMFEIVQEFKTIAVLTYYKNIILLNDNMFKNIKKFCNDLNDINNMGFVFKVSDDIVYARGLLRVQMSEMVRFELENESLFGIVNYLDNEGVAGITVLGDATNITAQTVVVRTYKQPTIGTGYNALSRVVNSIGEAIDVMNLYNMI